MVRFPTCCEQLSPEWLTTALGGPEALDGATVVGFEIARVGKGIGFLGALSRLSLRYDRDAPSAPRSLIVKLPAPEEGARRLTDGFRLYEKEVRFYEQLAAASPIHAPRAYFQAYDPETGDFALLLEDLAPRRNGDQLLGLSVAETQLAVEALGALQARWWEKPELHAIGWLPTFDDPSLMSLQSVFQQCWSAYRAFMAGRLEPAMLQLGDRLATRIQRIAEWLSTPPCTLVHGDFRADNFFFGDEASPLTVVDWQIVLKGRGAFDLAYLLTGSLPVAHRRAAEPDLLELYLASLRAGGVRDYGREDLRRDYQTCALFGWIWPVLAIANLDPANERGLAYFCAWSERVCTAIQDLKAGEVLEEFEALPA